MADSHGGSTPVIEVGVIALYPGRISALSALPGIRFRRRKERESTLVPCEVKVIDGQSIAAPRYSVPDGTGAPRYRAHIEMTRTPAGERRVVHLVLSAEPNARRMDPEQILLSPIFDDGSRLIFEFQQAYIFSVSRRGDVETRFVAVHPVLGTVGTRTIHRFSTRFSALATRCVEHLAGAIELFPQRERRTMPRHGRIPLGEADLSFGSGNPRSCKGPAIAEEELVRMERGVGEA